MITSEIEGHLIVEGFPRVDHQGSRLKSEAGRKRGRSVCVGKAKNGHGVLSDAPPDVGKVAGGVVPLQ